MAKAVEYIPYIVYGPNGTKEYTSDERCRLPPETELSLLDAGRTIKLGGKKITKKDVKILQEGKGNNENTRNRPRK